MIYRNERYFAQMLLEAEVDIFRYFRTKLSVSVVQSVTICASYSQESPVFNFLLPVH
jgi:hypothetical protein